MNQVFRILPLVVCVTIGSFLQSAHAFEFKDVVAKAKVLSQSPYKREEMALPQQIKNLSKEDYFRIHFNQDKAWWKKERLPFDMTFMHRGGIFTDGVKINEIINQQVKPIAFKPDMFDYANTSVDKANVGNIGFSGFRIRYPINSAKVMDDILSFQGASYFRAMGKDQGYGISARGLAVDTALYSGEEFPNFVEFWIVKPTAKNNVIKIYALLDSPRVSGAYQFTVQPGIDTNMDVTASLFFRGQVNKLGVAPLTSMFFFGSNQRSRHNDLRPEAHDSDGLSMSFNNEWIWRPLVNPKRLLITSFTTDNPKGFGLMQRARQFDDYEDLDNRYESRPSAWITPKGNWGKGRVELVQIPTLDETNDNIVAYWVPENNPKPGDSLDLAYRLSWQKNKEVKPPMAWVAQTRVGEGFETNAVNKKDGNFNVAIDFKGNLPEKLGSNASIEPVVQSDGNGQVINYSMRRNEAIDGWRIEILFHRNEENKPVELRAYLQDSAASKPVSETWSYILPAN